MKIKMIISIVFLSIVTLNGYDDDYGSTSKAIQNPYENLSDKEKVA